MSVQGTFNSGWQSAGAEPACAKCKVAGRVEFREWESSCGGYEDTKYRCGACGATWWVEGPDA